LSESGLKQTPLNSIHRKMGARMIEFGGWDMPVQYPQGTIEEHLRVRNHAGIFDVSHMGEIEVKGSGAVPFVNFLVSNDVTKLVDNQAHYSALLTPNGTVIDDLLVYRFSSEHLLLVVNASTTPKDWEWINSQKRDASVTLSNSSSEYFQIAIQGPDSPAILQQLTSTDLTRIRYYYFVKGEVCDIPVIISRTGYTGEDGFEIYGPPARAQLIWEALLEKGRYGEPDGIVACGLASRNTLRLEAAMALYGHEIDEKTTPLEANLGWICKLDKGEFIGRDVLLRQKSEGTERRLVGFEMMERSIARDDQEVYVDGKVVGRTTSASPAPYLRKNIGLAYIPASLAKEVQEIEIDIRGRRAKARIVPTPFYKRDKK
jgi:aminomethyltransferase